MQLTKNALILQQVQLWETLFDWLNDSKERTFTINKNEKCAIIGKQVLNNQTLYKLLIERTGQTGWILFGQYPSFEII